MIRCTLPVIVIVSLLYIELSTELVCLLFWPLSSFCYSVLDNQGKSYEIMHDLSSNKETVWSKSHRHGVEYIPIYLHAHAQHCTRRATQTHAHAQILYTFYALLNLVSNNQVGIFKETVRKKYYVL